MLGNIDETDEQIKNGNGIDHCFVFDQVLSPRSHLHTHAIVTQGDVQLTVRSNQPAMHLYTGNFMDGSIVDRAGPCRFRECFCCEPETIPNAVNRPDFHENVIYEKGQEYQYVVEYEFGDARK